MQVGRECLRNSNRMQGKGNGFVKELKAFTLLEVEWGRDQTSIPNFISKHKIK